MLIVWRSFNTPTASDKVLELIGFFTKTSCLISFLSWSVALSTTVFLLRFLVQPISTVTKFISIGHFDSDSNARASSTQTQTTRVGIGKEFITKIKISLSVSAFSLSAIAVIVKKDKTSLTTRRWYRLFSTST